MNTIARRLTVLAGASLVSLGALGSGGCNDHPLKEVELDRASEDDGIVDVVQRKDVDILFVIDNSGSMGEEQATLAANFGAFIEKLEDPDVEANYRIAVTTTDANHRHCAGGEDGRFQFSSCRSRAHEFQRGGTSDEANNFFDESCLSVCELDDLETIPTTTLDDPDPKPRPWIESIGGVTNLPEGITTTQAFQCAGPQGVAGCGYESPLESMRRAFLRTEDANEDEFGFVRPGAILAVVFVTDEADCSARWKDINDPWDADGMQTFWTEDNLDEGYPQSEVCWYSGVTCTDNGDGTKECHPANKDAAGMDADEDESVLFPISRYTDFLQAIENDKRERDLTAGLESSDVLVAVIGGVPTGYQAGDEIPYRDGLVGEDIDFQRQHGIAPGCSAEGVGQAVPPVRLRDFAASFETQDEDPTNLFSVCKPDYTPALDKIAKLIETQVRPACVPVCVEDTDPLTDTVEHQCVVTETVPNKDGSVTERTVPECEIDGGDARIPDDGELCYVSKSDQGGETETTLDDMDQTCIDEGWNLELKVVRADGVREEPGSSIRAKCTTSARKAVDCPGL